MSGYADVEIEVGSMTEVLRRRPDMWLHSAAFERAGIRDACIATLIAEQMCVHALDEAHRGRPLALRVDLAPNYVRVEYDAALRRDDVMEDGELVALARCRWDACEHTLQPFDGGLTLPIALSSHFRITVEHDGSCLELVFERGKLVHETGPSRHSRGSHTRLECWLDAEMTRAMPPEHEVMLEFLNQHEHVLDLRPGVSNSSHHRPHPDSTRRGGAGRGGAGHPCFLDDSPRPSCYDSCHDTDSTNQRKEGNMKSSRMNLAWCAIVMVCSCALVASLLACGDICEVPEGTYDLKVTEDTGDCDQELVDALIEGLEDDPIVIESPDNACGEVAVSSSEYSESSMCNISVAGFTDGTEEGLSDFEMKITLSGADCILACSHDLKIATTRR